METSITSSESQLALHIPLRVELISIRPAASAVQVSSFEL